MLTTIDKTNVPVHVGIIMDGNGRWAKQRNLPRTAGHKIGVDRAREIMLAASKAGVKYLTLYTFSTENWKRPAEEVNFLMNLLSLHLKTEKSFYKKNNIRLFLPNIAARGIQHPGQSFGGSGTVIKFQIKYQIFGFVIINKRRTLHRKQMLFLLQTLAAILHRPELQVACTCKRSPATLTQRRTDKGDFPEALGTNTVALAQYLPATNTSRRQNHIQKAPPHRHTLSSCNIL